MKGPTNHSCQKHIKSQVDVLTMENVKSHVTNTSTKPNMMKTQNYFIEVAPLNEYQCPKTGQKINSARSVMHFKKHIAAFAAIKFQLSSCPACDRLTPPAIDTSRALANLSSKLSRRASKLPRVSVVSSPSEFPQFSSMPPYLPWSHQHEGNS